MTRDRGEVGCGATGGKIRLPGQCVCLAGRQSRHPSPRSSQATPHCSPLLITPMQVTAPSK